MAAGIDLVKTASRSLLRRVCIAAGAITTNPETFLKSTPQALDVNLVRNSSSFAALHFDWYRKTFLHAHPLLSKSPHLIEGKITVPHAVDLPVYLPNLQSHLFGHLMHRESFGAGMMVAMAVNPEYRELEGVDEQKRKRLAKLGIFDVGTRGSRQWRVFRIARVSACLGGRMAKVWAEEHRFQKTGLYTDKTVIDRVKFEQPANNVGGLSRRYEWKPTERELTKMETLGGKWIVLDKATYQFTGNNASKKKSACSKDKTSRLESDLVVLKGRD